jgi:twitching motility protein PilJ
MIAQGSSSTEDYVQMQQLLSHQVNILQFEFATLVSSDYTIQVGANNNRTGETFNPSGIAAKAMKLGAPLAVTVAMDYAEFAKEGAPRFL